MQRQSRFSFTICQSFFTETRKREKPIRDNLVKEDFSALINFLCLRTEEFSLLNETRSFVLEFFKQWKNFSNKSKLKFSLKKRKRKFFNKKSARASASCSRAFNFYFPFYSHVQVKKKAIQARLVSYSLIFCGTKWEERKKFKAERQRKRKSSLQKKRRKEGREIMKIIGHDAIE